MFSEKKTPISELIQGVPERPMREPAIVALACLFNLYQIYRIFEVLPQAAAYSSPDPFLGGYFAMIASMLGTLLGWYLVYSVILCIGAAVVYFANRRAGSALIFAISIIGFIMGFVGIGMLIIFSLTIVDAITALFAPIIGVISGIYGIRSQRTTGDSTVHEVI
ncbi:MAG: hypothetical protein Q6361_04530 [Candidatus Hermodarchaeota archaeon]|nr:hypothetical protein [Candidatus Hermodarchaeota archaeon]